MEIDKNIPIPKATSREKYPYASMEIGDSFIIFDKNRNTIGNATTYYSMKLNRKFITRKVVENGKEGIRIWRTA